jgi:dihydrofolate reductase
MRKVIYSMFVSLDGFIAGPNNELDWHIIDEELHRFVNDQERTRGTFLYGRRMYDVMSYWQTADTNPANPAYVIEYAHIWQSIPKIVFSKTLKQVGPNARLIEGNIAEEIAQLKKQPGKDMTVGGANIASTFMQLGLIDEYQSYIHPVVLGNGTPMFPSLANKINLKLIETRTFGSGVVFLRYRPGNQEQ